jgi:hypothetical protein
VTAEVVALLDLHIHSQGRCEKYSADDLDDD